MAAFEKNFYLRLDLSVEPPVLDKAKLLEAIKKKEGEWNNNSNHPTDSLRYKKQVEQVPEMKEKLTGANDAERDAIIREAKEIINERLIECVKSFSQKGYVTPDDIDKMCKEIPQVPKTYIQNAVQVPIKAVAPPTFTPPKKPADPSVKPTDKPTMDKYDRLLQVVERDDIYAFLGCANSSSESNIIQLADGIIKRALNAPKKTAVVSAESELAGSVKTDFGKPNAKMAYDLALKNYRAETKLVKSFSFRVSNKAVVRADYIASIKEAREIGMSKEEAEWFVYDFYVEKRKCIYPMPPENEKPAPEKQYCKVCLAGNEADAKGCQKCGMPFKVECPKCKTVAALDKSFCSCGFPIGDMPMALNLLKEAKGLLAVRKLPEAEVAVRRALAYWPSHSECVDLERQIKQEFARVQEERDRQQREKNEAEAKSLLEGLALAGDVKAAVSSHNSIALSWKTIDGKPSAVQSKIAYWIVRKKDAVPSTPEDGERLVETQAGSYEDTTPVAGQVYGYAVFPCYL